MPSIILDNINVTYPVWQDHSLSFRRALLSLAKRKLNGKPPEIRTVHALKDVSLTLNNGDRVALIGYNGAGKSTLLRTLGGFILPDSGHVTVSGNITAMLGVNGGLNLEKTGYGNIFYIGRLLGFKRAHMQQRIADIQALSELGQALHMPVHSYSDGMKVRLGMSIMSCVQPDILVFDEGVGAADVHFIETYTDHLQKIYDQGRIIVMASHSHNIIRKLCNKVIWMEQGRILRIGAVDEMLEAYTQAAAA